MRLAAAWKKYEEVRSFELSGLLKSNRYRNQAITAIEPGVAVTREPWIKQNAMPGAFLDDDAARRSARAAKPQFIKPVER
jgi:hypothetical protein